ncbi:MAG TPA: hypothetical protein VMJ32_09760 [Pirellulales bacterium]|nr:hypothetical protein [Pirellulales bacterium]
MQLTRNFYAIGTVLVGLFLCGAVQGATYYVATNGSDTGAGTLSQPFASIAQAQQAASSGDTVYIRGGTYTNFSVAATDATYQYVLNFTKSNINYLAYPGDPSPILNFSNIAPTTLRVCGIQVTGSNDTFQGINVTGVQAGTLKQADNWRITGNGNTFNEIVTHDDQGNGMYFLSHSSNNLVLNCDSYNLVGVNGISAGNTDGFGCHSAGSGNVFRGDRSWGNSDDGYDCIDNSGGGVTFDHCWAYDNGRFDGNKNGFKIGGFGDTGGSFPDPPSANTVEFCLSADNGANGFYANHQPGQAANWYNNTAYNNHGNFNMLEAIDTSPENSSVPGTREVLHNNLAYVGTGVSNLDETGSMVANNWFTLPVTVSAADFQSLDATQMTLPRQADGSLPDIAFMNLAAGSDLIDAGLNVGLPYLGAAPDLGAFETVPEPSTFILAVLAFGLLVALPSRRPALRAPQQA